MARLHASSHAWSDGGASARVPRRYGVDGVLDDAVWSSATVIDDFTHKIIGRKTVGGKKVTVIESVPKPGVPVVWGKEVIEVREDGVLMSVAYYDQLGKRVRIMTADKVSTLAGRPYPVVLTMRTDAKPGQYTQVTTKSAEFDIALPSYLFTQSNLRNPRD